MPWGGGGSSGGCLKWYVDDLGLPQAMHLYLDDFVVLVDLVSPAASRPSCFPAGDNVDIAETGFLAIGMKPIIKYGKAGAIIGSGSQVALPTTPVNQPKTAATMNE